MMQVSLLLESLRYVFIFLFILLACFLTFHIVLTYTYAQHLFILGTQYEQLLPCNIVHFFMILDHACESCRA